MSLSFVPTHSQFRRKTEPRDEKMEAKDEDDDETSAVKQDPDSDDEDNEEETSKEGADIRDIRYNLEKLCAHLLDQF